MLAKRKMKLNDLSAAVGVSVVNLSILKTSKAKAIRFSTLEAICRALNCQPGDILEFREDSEDESTSATAIEEQNLPESKCL